MNTIQNVLQEHKGKRVWFYLPKEETRIRFLKDLIEMKARWKDGQPVNTDHNISDLMAVHEDGEVGFISSLCWKMSFMDKYKDEIIHIDFEKCEKEKKDYMMDRPQITYVCFE